MTYRCGIAMTGTCDSVHWYDGAWCVLDVGHAGDHRDDYGLTWRDDETASQKSAVRMHGPWPLKRDAREALGRMSPCAAQEVKPTKDADWHLEPGEEKF